jgi:fatty-acyl-CoA synthase
MDFKRFYDMTLDAALRTQAEAHADRTFVAYENQSWSYLGLEPGDRLAILLPNLPEFIITLFAAARAGLIVVPISVRYTKEELTSFLAKTRSQAIATFSDPAAFKGIDHLAMILDLQPELPDLEHVISLEAKQADVIDWNALSLSNAAVPKSRSKPGDPFAILHTVGVSGEPCGVVLKHHSLVRNAADIAARMRCTPDDVFLGATPFSNTFGITPTILSCLVSGATLVPLAKYDPGSTLDLIESAGITVHHGVPTMFILELSHAEFRGERCATLRTGIMSGAHCPPKLVERVREKMGINLILAYGLTEASPSVTMTNLDDGPITATQTTGIPMEDVEIKVIDLEGNSLPAGEEGEICVRGYNVMVGYWDDKEATDQALDSKGWLHTGDLAVISPDGPVRILGRKDELINRGGFGIHPARVEMVMRSHPKVRDVAVVGVPDMIYGEIACACVVRTPDSQVDAETLLDFAGERLADYAVPDRLIFFESLPHIRTGAIRKDVLRDLVRNRGRAWKFGKNIDTDAIIPARHCTTADANELAQHCMEDADPEFIKKMRRGDLIVADTNFGCGSSREVAPLCIKAAGVSAVIAKSFARIFFRNAINIGLPILECPEAVDGIEAGDEIEVEPASGTIRNLTRGTSFQSAAYPEFLQRIIEHGGLLPYVEERLKDNER